MKRDFRPDYLPTWVQGGEVSPSQSGWIVYDESEGFSPAYALVWQDNAQDAADEACDLAGGRLNPDSETLIAKKVWR